jgi:hypothetical protein
MPCIVCFFVCIFLYFKEHDIFFLLFPSLYQLYGKCGRDEAEKELIRYFYLHHNKFQSRVTLTVQYINKKENIIIFHSHAQGTKKHNLFILNEIKNKMQKKYYIFQMNFKRKKLKKKIIAFEVQSTRT